MHRPPIPGGRALARDLAELQPRETKGIAKVKILRISEKKIAARDFMEGAVHSPAAQLI
jgi:hypothetical protein